MEHLDAWFRGLEELDHHDPEYGYDWTTDPDSAMPERKEERTRTGAKCSARTFACSQTGGVLGSSVTTLFRAAGTIAETDEQHRIRAEGREEERIAAALSVIREFLESKLSPANLNRIEMAWCWDGPPTDAFRRSRAVQRTPDEWCSLLQIPDDDIGPARIR